MLHAETRKRLPCMVAAIQDVTGAVVGVHRTFLAPDGSAKAEVRPAKKMNGRAWGGAVRLSMPAPILVLAEGIETAMAMQRALEHNKDHCFWAGLSLGNLAGKGRGKGLRHPNRKSINGHPLLLPSSRPDHAHPGIEFPNWVKEVVLLADADNGDPYAADKLLNRAANRYRAWGKNVHIATPHEHTDFNDVVRGVVA